LNLFPQQHAISVRFLQLFFSWLRSIFTHLKFDVAAVKVDSPLTAWVRLVRA
jgi:hypothetical protein